MNARARSIETDTRHVRPVPRFALRPQEAADALGVSLSLFNELVEEGLMPKAITLPGHSGVRLYDAKAVGEAWEEIVAANFRAKGSKWDDVK